MRYLTFKKTKNPLTYDLKKNLVGHACLKMYQNKNEVFMTSGTWFGTTLEMAILAILFILYII